ncbi:MAG: HipA domain-containing protein [Lachnospiraceae bacterium]|nr:HipA domain-containing protein [Lachnospiraceae bacterium]
MTYDDSYLDSPNAKAVSLTMPLTHETYKSGNLFPFFDGLIPEGWLLNVVERNWKIDGKDRFGLLLAACRDCIGDVYIIAEDNKYVYITKRVDRIKNKMKAMEDFCQLSGRPTADKYKGSYESCSKIIKNFSKNVGIDISEFYYRLLFCFITGNSDMHLKNFSLIESKPGSRVFGLSEAYDLLPVTIILPEDQEQTALTLNGKKKNIRKKDFHALASSLEVTSKTSDVLTKRLISLEKKFIETTQDSMLPKEMQTTFIELMDSRIAIFK